MPSIYLRHVCGEVLSDDLPRSQPIASFLLLLLHLFSAFVMSFKEHALSSASSSTTAFGPLTSPANGEKAVAGARPDPEKGPAFFDNDESECPDGGLKAWLCVFGVRYFPGMMI